MSRLQTRKQKHISSDWYNYRHKVQNQKTTKIIKFTPVELLMTDGALYVCDRLVRALAHALVVQRGTNDLAIN